MDKEQLEAALNDDIAKGHSMRYFRDHFLANFFQAKELQFFEAIKELPITGSDAELKEIHHQIKSLEALRVEIQSVIDTGNMSEHQKKSLKLDEN